MTDKHPITPPTELVARWRAFASNIPTSSCSDPGGRRDYIDYIATAATQWGADQELEACCEVVNRWVGPWHPGIKLPDRLRAARRLKSPSLKEQALEAAQRFYAKGHESCTDEEVKDDFDAICRALEALPND